MPMLNTDFIVNKQNLSETRYVETELPDSTELTSGQALLKVDEFALTANNITYGVAGEFLRYWDFFPTEVGWGRIPVWGFADVVASTVEGLVEGERLYGYLPMSTHLLVEPGHITPYSFMDTVAHRQERSPIYNQYTKTHMDPTYKKEHEGLISLFRPLFTTSFLLDDYQAENSFFGAESIILSSASSKTAIGTAHLLAKRSEHVSVIGLTSKANMAFVESLGCYDTIVAYEDVESLPSGPAAFVDMAGNAQVTTRIHNHFGDNLKDSCMVGTTHWHAFGRLNETLPGPKPELFFAPSYAQERIKEWGMDGFQKRVAQVWNDFIPSTTNWISLKQGQGQEALLNAYQALLTNMSNPAHGHILSLWD